MASLVKFKVTKSVSNDEAKLQNRIPVMLRQLLCCKIASAGINFGASSFRLVGCHNVAFSES